MVYTVLLKRSAERELERLPIHTHDKIVKRLLALGHAPRSPGTKKLRGREGYKVRVGDYRILYIVNDQEKTVEVFSIAHRREVYR